VQQRQQGQERPSSFFDHLMGELQRLCENSCSGTLFVTTNDSHAARFAFRDGVIVGIVYRTKNGLDAIPFINEIKGGSFSFSSTNVFLSGSASVALPSTPEIFRLMGVAVPRLSALRPAVVVQPPMARPTTERTLNPGLRAPAPVMAAAHEPAAVPAKKILVVEDSAITRKLIAKALIEGGYTVLQAENGLAAFAQLSEIRPDLMLLDIIMPGIDGYKVLSMIRKHDDFKSLPVIMLTSRDGLLDKLRGKIGGSNEYLTKPFTPEELLAKIAKYLD